MNRRIRFSLAAAFAILLCSAMIAAAQPLPWNPPCTTLRIKSLVNAPVTITLVTTPGGVIPTITIPPFGVSPTLAVPIGMTVDGVISAAGFFYPSVLPGPPSPPAPFPAAGWIPSVTVGPPPSSCVDLYLDLGNNCTVYVFPGTPPCRP